MSDTVESPTNLAVIGNLKPGHFVDLQINIPLPTRIKLPLVGYETGRYLILKYPDPKKHGSYKDVLQNSHVVIGRFLVEGDTGECAAFQSTIRSVTNAPEKLIFLDFPKRIETRQLRKHQRVQTHIPCELTTLDDDIESSSEQRVSGLINDLSMDGCKFIFKAQPGITGVKQRPVRLYFRVPGVDEQQSITAYVRNSRLEGKKVSVGIQFSDDRSAISELMNALMIDLENFEF